MDYSCILANESHTYTYHGLAVKYSLSLSNGTYCPTKYVSTADNILANTKKTAQLVFNGPTVFISCAQETQLTVNGQDYDCTRQNGTRLPYIILVKFEDRERVH